jgi:hypothetical protein
MYPYLSSLQLASSQLELDLRTALECKEAWRSFQRTQGTSFDPTGKVRA